MLDTNVVNSCHYICLAAFIWTNKAILTKTQQAIQVEPVLGTAQPKLVSSPFQTMYYEHPVTGTLGVVTGLTYCQ